MKATHQGHRGDLAVRPRVYLLGKMVHMAPSPPRAGMGVAGLEAWAGGRLVGGIISGRVMSSSLVFVLEDILRQAWSRT